MAPAIHVGPDAPEHLVRAVEDGGGRLVALEEAEARRLGRGPESDFRELPDSVRWVQLQSAGDRAVGGADPRHARTCSSRRAVGAYATQVAELALGAAARRRARVRRATRAPGPGTRRTTGTLEGSTVAIVGAGGIGRELIKMLEPHDVEIDRRHAQSGRDGTLPRRRASARSGARPTTS